MKLNAIAGNYRKRKGLRITLHLLFWIIFYAVVYYINSVSFVGAYREASVRFLVPLRMILPLAGAYYPIVYFMIPRLVVRRKYVWSMLVFLAIIVLYTLLDFITEGLILQNCRPCIIELKRTNPSYYQFLQSPAEGIILSRLASLGIVYQLMLYLALPVGLKLAVEYYQQRIKAVQLAKENLQLEFNFLKAQVNPHFLFNTLNNLYGLILQERKEESAETVTMLANFMRYTLYECNGEKNSIEKEIKVLKEYIALEKIRLNATDVQFRYTIADANTALPPLLLMPVVENAFKYCVEKRGEANWINLHLEVDQHRLLFTASNTFQEKPVVNGAGGIGLVNLKKRLEHFYPGKYVLQAGPKENVYHLTLNINF